METSRESNPQSGNENAEVSDQQLQSGANRTSDMAPEVVDIVPFSENDPFRATRISETVGETASLLSEVQMEASGFQGATPEQFAALSRDAAERASWSQTRQDGFIGLLRLGKPTPSRSQRIL